MTYNDIQKALQKQINYSELANLLELDLNNIAGELIQDPQHLITFQVFFDTGEFNSTIEEQSFGEGEGFLITPVLLKFVNGDYSSMKGPEFFSTVFSIEVMGFDKDRENLRKIFETYSYMNQGLIDKDDLGVYITKTLEFPFFGEAFQFKGRERTQGFMRLFINYMYEGQMSNEVECFIDNKPAKIQDLEISRNRVSRTQQMNGTPEIINTYESQVLTVAGTMIFDGSPAAKTLFKSIKDLEQGLETTLIFRITYPNIFKGTYGWLPSTQTEADEIFNTVLPSATDFTFGTVAELVAPVKIQNMDPRAHQWTMTIVSGSTQEEILQQIKTQLPTAYNLIVSQNWNTQDIIRATDENSVQYFFKITYKSNEMYEVGEVLTNVHEEDLYKVNLDNGTIKITEGGTVVLNFTLALVEV